MHLQDDVTAVKGIGAKKRERLAAMGIQTVADLLEHLPFRYRDRRNVIPSFRLEENRDQLAIGRLLRKRIHPLSGRRTMLVCAFTDEAGSFEAVFFNMPFLAKSLTIGKEYAVFGKCRRQLGRVSFNSPEICERGSTRDVRGILPVYRCTAGITTLDFNKWVRQILNDVEWGDEWLPQEVIRDRKLCGESFAFRNLHFPENEQSYKIARYRYLYDQLFIYMLAIRWNRENIRNSAQDASLPAQDLSPFFSILPFELTEGQKEAVEDINRDLTSARPMNRLIQGDVGCGKTVVAEAAIYRVARSGRQAVLMAPTEILARQHYKRISEDMNRLGIACALTINAMKTSDKRENLSRIASGEAKVVIGTHAVLSDNVIFRDLALVVTDEQHRFGVNQRRILVEKASAMNVLVMSATPIPRTLAATVFGDMDFSIIRHRPAERKSIITRAADRNSRGKAYADVLREVRKGNRAYVVAPAIEDGEEQNAVVSVEKLYDELRKKFRGFQVRALHGRMSADEKEGIMLRFASGEIDILISTVVVEVGIDVPEATIIVIENCDRFGLAQLHQLRGRVGRSERQSYCWLINYGRSEVAAERVRIMTETDDGFEISEEDYRLRGPGDVMGTMQHGAAGSEMELFRHTAILEQAKEDAETHDVSVDEPEVRRRIEKISREDNSDIL